MSRSCVPFSFSFLQRARENTVILYLNLNIEQVKSLCSIQLSLKLNTTCPGTSAVSQVMTKIGSVSVQASMHI